MEAHVEYRIGLCQGTILPLRTPKEWKLAFWHSKTGQPELELNCNRGKNIFKVIQKKRGHVKYIELEIDQPRLDQLYEMILSFQLTELVMFESDGTDRPGYNFHLTVQSEETIETVVVKIRDSDSTYVTDKWLPTWELLCVALRGWMDRTVAALTVSFDVLLEGELSKRCFELRINNARVLEMLEPARQAFGQVPRVTLQAAPGDAELLLTLNGRQLGTAIRVQARKCVQLSYDPDFELGALTLTETSPVRAAAPAAEASTSDVCASVVELICSCCRDEAVPHRRRSFELLLAADDGEESVPSGSMPNLQQPSPRQRVPLTEWELDRAEPAVLISGSLEELEQKLRAARPLPHLCIETTQLNDDPAAAASLADAIIANRAVRHVRFTRQALPPRELASVIRQCEGLESVSGVALTQELVDALLANPRVRRVGLAPGQLGRPSQVSLLERLLSLGSIQSLDLSHLDLGLHTDMLRQLDHSLRSNRSLQLLYLRSNALKPKGMCNLLDCLADAEVPLLRGLFLHYNSIGTESVRRITNWVIRGHARLRYLEVAQNTLNEDASVELARLLYFKAPVASDSLIYLDIGFNPDLHIAPILEALRMNDSLTSIDLSGLMLLDEADGARLASVLRTNGVLSSLKCNSAQLTDQWMTAVLAPALRRNSALHVLELAFNRFTVIAAAGLADVLAEHPNLRYLNLDNNGFDLRGASVIIESLGRNRNAKLQRLSLNRNLIGEAGADKFVDILGAAQSLRELELAGNPIGHANAWLREMRPSLRIKL